MATFVYEHTGPPAPAFRPSADFDWQPDPNDETTIAFTDYSEANEGEIVAWHWDFADGTTFDGRTPPPHRFAPGEYTVALTVTDDQGRTDTINRTVYIEEPVDTGG
jgi:PKD repeat protein